MVATEAHLMKGIISFRPTILGRKVSFFFRFWTFFGKISMTLTLHLHIYLKFSCSPPSSTEKKPSSSCIDLLPALA